MARIIIDIPDEYVDWARWVQDNLAKGGLPNTQIAETVNGAPVDTTGQNAAPASTEAPATDPWAAAGASSATTQAATPSATAAAPASQATQTSSPNRIVKPTAKGDFVYQLGLNNAPTCNCGDVAARLTAPKKAGGTYTKWTCAKDSGSDWKEKCDFSQWG
jgi:hypothetical protein